MHNQKSLLFLLCSYGMHFQEFLTHRRSAEIALIYLMRPLVDSGIRIKSFYKLARELYFKKYSKLMIQREFGVIKLNNSMLENKNHAQIFSNFSEREMYAGITSSSSYLSSVY